MPSIDCIKLTSSINYEILKRKITDDNKKNYGYKNQCSICSLFDEENNLIQCCMCKLLIFHPECDDYKGVSVDGYFCYFCRKELNMEVLNIELL